MKLQYLSLGLSFVLGAAAQGIGDLAPCAQKCATGSLPESCSMIDVKCICSAISFINDMSCCVAKSCPKDKQQQALGYASKICHGAGVSDLPKSPSCASTTGGGSQTTATAATTTNASATDASPTGAAYTESATKSDSATSTGTGSSTASATSESSTNAAVTFGQYKDAALAAAAGAAAFAIVA
ncbi:CFEM domain protein [Aspergillus sp. HF37]|nr:CFEM domain protein [Aspergillus sp. HF37]